MGTVKTQIAWPPRGLAVAASLVVAESLVLFISKALTGLNFLQLGVALLLGLFLLRGSRIAWVLTILGSVIQCASLLSESQPWWALCATPILLVALLAPTSTRFVWTEESQRPAPPFFSAVQTFSERIVALSYIGVARVARWEDDLHGDDLGGEPRRYGLLIWRLGVAAVFLFLLGGTIGVWQEGSARNSLIVDILASVTWISYFAAQLAFIGALAFAAYSYVTTRKTGTDTEPRS